jgi:hypothetical protein
MPDEDDNKYDDNHDSPNRDRNKGDSKRFGMLIYPVFDVTGYGTGTFYT